MKKETTLKGSFESAVRASLRRSIGDALYALTCAACFVESDDERAKICEIQNTLVSIANKESHEK